jgi:protease I
MIGMTYSMPFALPQRVRRETTVVCASRRSVHPKEDGPERRRQHGRLDGKTIAFLATDGVEQVELTKPWEAVREAGGAPELISLEDGEIQGFEHLDKGDTFSVDRTAAAADAGAYDGLVLPGGVANPDFLRADKAAVAFVRAFFDAGKPVAAICHGPWTLIDAGVVEGRTLTSWPSLQTDLRNPDDLPAFCAKLVEEIAEGVHEEQRERTHA